MNFSEILKTYRKYLELTQRDLVALIRNSGADYRTIDVVSFHRWESGKVKPSAKKQAVVLDSLGLAKCVKAIEIKEGRNLTSYLEKRFDIHPYPNYAFGLSEDKLRSELWTSLNELPQFIIDMQKKVFDLEEPKEFLTNILSISQNSYLHVYFNRENSIIGHLLYVILKSRDFENFHSNYIPYVPINLDSEGVTLAIVCGFAPSKHIFSDQFIKVIDFLFLMREIKYVYIRSYDPLLTSALSKSTACLVLSKNKQWTGLLIESRRMKMVYSIFKRPSCKGFESCDVRICYGN